MPKIAEIREIDGDIWCRIGRASPEPDFPSGVSIWTPEEQIRNANSGWFAAIDQAVEICQQTNKLGTSLSAEYLNREVDMATFIAEKIRELKP